MPQQKKAECFALAELQQLIKQSPDLATIIDVRSPAEYTEKHIPGAINIPMGELARRSNELSKRAVIITVCGNGGGRSAEAAALLKQLGFVHTNFLCWGTFGWYDEYK